MSAFAAPSVVGTISDLDGFSVQGDNFYGMQPTHYPQPHHETDDFGFDPPHMVRNYPIKMEQTYSPPEDSVAAFDSFDHIKSASGNISPMHQVNAVEIDRMIAQNLPNASTAIARYGQVTPPRSNSESSIENKAQQDRRKRASRASLKEETSSGSMPSGRKRRNTRKQSTSSITGNPEEDEKRRQSLEKNRLAAAKCRVNKKEKTEQLQRDSHDKAVQNAFLKEQIMRMKEEVQQMNALLLNHVNCEGCKSPDDIQKHLTHLGNEFYTHHMPPMGSHDYSGFPTMQVDGSEMDHESVMHENYFSPASDPSLMNPPLPEFDREPDFDVTTPMHTD